VLLLCWLGHVTRKTVSEMTYKVSSGTLNSTIPIPSTRHVSDKSIGEFRFAYETYHTRILFLERYVRTLAYSILAYAYPRAMITALALASGPIVLDFSLDYYIRHCLKVSFRSTSTSQPNIVFLSVCLFGCYKIAFIKYRGEKFSICRQ